MSEYTKSYSSQNTAILIVDPFNDFLSEGGKRWSRTKETVKGVNLIENLKSILSAARSFGHVQVQEVFYKNYNDVLNNILLSTRAELDYYHLL